MFLLFSAYFTDAKEYVINQEMQVSSVQQLDNKFYKFVGGNFSMNLWMGTKIYVYLLQQYHMLVCFMIKCKNSSQTINCSLDTLQLSLKCSENGYYKQKMNGFKYKSLFYIIVIIISNESMQSHNSFKNFSASSMQNP